MKIYYCRLGLTLIIYSLFLSGCSSITDTIAASSQTFTNTSEATTNVSKSSPSAKNSTAKAVYFTKVNWMSLTANMSKGKGEHLAALATLLGVKETQKSAFYAMTQKKFPLLFKNANTTAEQLVSTLQLEIAQL